MIRNRYYHGIHELEDCVKYVEWTSTFVCLQIGRRQKKCGQSGRAGHRAPWSVEGGNSTVSGRARAAPRTVKGLPE